MSNENYQFLVTIDTLTELNYPSIGLSNGIINWTPTVDGYDTLEYVAGRFADNWISTLSSGARVSQGGALAFTNKAIINLMPTSGIYEAFQDLNLQSGNMPVTISIRQKSDGSVKVLKSWVTGLITPLSNMVTIEIEDITRNRESDSPTPYYLGTEQLIEMKKEEVVSEIVETLLGKAPVFYCRGTAFERAYIYPYLVEPTQQQMVDWYTLVHGNKKGVLFVNGVEAESMGLTSTEITGTTYYGLVVHFKTGNIRDGNGVLPSDPIQTVTITDRLNTYNSDEYVNSGGFADKVLRFKDGTALGEVYADSIVFETSTITSYEYDEVGYKSAILNNPFENVGVVTQEIREELGVDDMDYQGYGFYLHHGEFENLNINPHVDYQNITDDEYNTFGYSEISLTAKEYQGDPYYYVYAGYRIAHINSIALPPLDSTKKYYINMTTNAGDIAGNWDGIADPDARQCYNISKLVGVGYRSKATGKSHIVSPSVDIGKGYNVDSWDVSASSDSTILDNYFPLLKNSPISQEPFRWLATGESITPNLNGFSFGLSDILSDIDISSGGTIFISTQLRLENYNGTATNGFTNLKFKYRNISIVEEVNLPLSPIYTNWNGRKVGTELVTTTGQAYNLACRLQNLSDARITPPTMGWGTEEPTVSDWNNHIDSTTIYGGCYAPTMSFGIQGSVSDAEKLKKELAVAMVGVGAVGDDGIEHIYSLVDGLFNTNGVLIDHSELFKGSEAIIKAVDQSEIFNEYVVNNVSVTGVEAENKESGQDETAWLMGKALYDAYKVKRRYKKNNLITTADTPIFIRKMLMWFGVNDEFRDNPALPTNWVAYQRFNLILKLPLSMLFTKELFVGAKIRYNDVWQGLFGGVITDRAIDPKSGTFSITASCTNNKTVSGSDKIIYMETGNAIDTIIETGNAIDTIIEGQ